jgi:hypothetical protein
MPPSTWRWSRHGLPRRLSAGSSGWMRVKAWSVSSNIGRLLVVDFQERDAIGQRHHQQQSAAAVLGLFNRSLEGLDGIDLAANGLGGLERLPGRTASLRVIAIGGLLACDCHRRPPFVSTFSLQPRIKQV